MYLRFIASIFKKNLIIFSWVISFAKLGCDHHGSMKKVLTGRENHSPGRDPFRVLKTANFGKVRAMGHRVSGLRQKQHVWIGTGWDVRPHGSLHSVFEWNRGILQNSCSFGNGFLSVIKWAPNDFSLWFLWVIKLHYGLQSLRWKVIFCWVFKYLHVHI